MNVTVSIRVMSAGQGYRYLLRSVAAGDGDRDSASAVTRYYAEEGTPPGTWIGSGVLGLESVGEGEQVSEDQVRRLMGHGEHPITGEPLGRAYRKFATVQERVACRAAELPAHLIPEEREARLTLIRAEELLKGTGTAVAGFDLTFSAPKSVSTLWGVADGGVQVLIVDAHHRAVRDVISLIERDVAMTRIGAEGPRGAIAQVEIRGVIGAAFDHYDSRAADPQLHTHVVVANRVQGVHDGKWRTLDSRALHSAITGLSEHYNALLTDHLANSLSLPWDGRDRGAGRMTSWEVEGVPQGLMDEFSARTRDIERVKDRIVAEYVSKHGRQPSRSGLWQIRQQATLDTRPRKETHSLGELTTEWRQRAARTLGRDAVAWASQLVAAGSGEALLRADDVRLDDIEAIAGAVLAQVAERRSTWRRWNLHAEAVRQTMPLRFATTADREAIIGLIVDAAQAQSLLLTPPELSTIPEAFRRPDGRSVFRSKASEIYSSETVLQAEERLLSASRRRSAPTVPLAAIERAARIRGRAHRSLGADQADAIARIAVSGRVLDLLVGPAGTGKTTTMGALRQAWERSHGAGSVIGLAPSAAAAAVLGDELSITTENTAKWIHEHQYGSWTFRAGQLVIVDEASLAGTFALDRITSHASELGAKVLLVGDEAQLQAVDAGGAFGMLVRDRNDAPRLSDVRRFRHDWEKQASLQLRLGEIEAVDSYVDHDRITEGTHEEVLDAAYRRWLTDSALGKISILVAETKETVAALNERARSDRILAGSVVDGGVRLRDGTRASKGDVVITRHNDRRLTLGTGWVKNNDRWIVTATQDDGTLTIRRERSRWRTTITLPANYVADFVDLGYAITAHRAQGATVDTAHAVVASPQMTREALYVAMTRGREANNVYVATDEQHLEEHQYREDLQMTARSVLYGILQHSGTELSAHETGTSEHNDWYSIRQLAAEYETIAQVAQHERWATLLSKGGLPEASIDELVTAESYGLLSTELRRLEADGHDVDNLLPRVVAAGNLENVEDLGSLLRYRIRRVANRYRPSEQRRQLMVGLVPRAIGVSDAGMSEALAQREHQIQNRTRALLTVVTADPHSWAHSIGLSTETITQTGVGDRIAVIVAYRDRYGISGRHPLGSIPDEDGQRIDYQRASQALADLRLDAKSDTVDRVHSSTISRSTL